MNKKNLTIALVLAVIILAGSVYYFKKIKNQTPTSNSNIVLNSNVNNDPVDQNGLRTYTNQTLNFSLKYPQVWIHDQIGGEDSVTFRSEPDGQWIFSVRVEDAGDSLANLAETIKTSEIASGYKVKSTDATVDGQPAIQLSMSGGEGVYGDTGTLVVFKGKLYTISEGTGSDPDQKAMLASFKFID